MANANSQWNCAISKVNAINRPPVVPVDELANKLEEITKELHELKLKVNQHVGPLHSRRGCNKCGCS